MPRQRLRASVIWKKVQQFVAEDGDAAGLESDDGDSRFDFGRERVENFKKQCLRAIEHAEVVERTAAAEIGAWENHVISGGFENIDGGFGGRGQEIVVEGVGPEENCASVGG